MPHFSFLTSESANTPPPAPRVCVCALARLEEGQSCRHQHISLRPSEKNKEGAGSWGHTVFCFLFFVFLERVEKSDGRSLCGTWTFWGAVSKVAGVQQYLRAEISISLTPPPTPSQVHRSLGPPELSFWNSPHTWPQLLEYKSLPMKK